MSIPMQFQFGKRQWISVTPTSEIRDKPKQSVEVISIFTVPGWSNNNQYHFLIDSGADISVLPHRMFTPDNKNIKHSLLTANGREIVVYGEKTISLNIPSIPGSFKWTFTVADVKRPILGSDFLSKYHILIDCHNNRIFQRKQENETDYDDQTVLRIDTKGPPVHQRARRLGPLVLKQIKQEFDDLIKQDIIQPSNSEWASPMVVVKKKDGTLRPCGDYRMLNAITKPDRYPLPRMNDILDKINGCIIFSTLDLRKAYPQIPISSYIVAHCITLHIHTVI